MKEHPNWLPSWLGYAQYGETIIICVDRDVARKGRETFHGCRPNKYDVVIGPEPCEVGDGCEDPGVPHGRVLWTGEDREEAMQAFLAAQVELSEAIRVGTPLRALGAAEASAAEEDASEGTMGSEDGRAG